MILVKIKNTYLLFVTIFGLISLAMYTTYAMFTASIDIGGFVDLTASNLPTDTSVIEYERLTLSAGETKIIDLNITKTALEKMKVDEFGLDSMDYNLLNAIIDNFNGGPVGIDALASSIGEEASTIEDVCEPYLLQNGFLKRTSRGRMVTEKTYEYLKKGANSTLF